MNFLRKWQKPALALVALLVMAQVGVSALAHTRRVHNFLAAHLERSFGRPVEVRSFSALLFPAPVLEAEQISVAEDPAFGHEYFLRAEHLTAGLRWAGLLRGHFEFGTLSLSRPSLILVRSEAGNWNLERWLPTARRSGGSAALIFYGPQPVPSATNRLQKIDIDDGRINFKEGADKLPFAFTGVSGSIEQVSPGRWRLQLQAQPWRSGVALQSAGTLFVQGDVAGTSARLQPAEVHVHWQEVSLADLFRLFRGQDYGVRGQFSLDASAKSAGLGQLPSVNVQQGDWTYSLRASASHIHRWDLLERRDNPSVDVNLEGHWNIVAHAATADRFVVQAPASNLRGSAHVGATATSAWELLVDSAGIQASDMLAWYRAFHADVDDKLVVRQFFTGAMTLRGWPLELQDAAFSSSGGELEVPGLATPLKVSGFTGGRQRAGLILGPVQLSYATEKRIGPQDSPNLPASKRRSESLGRSSVEFTLLHDFAKHAGAVTINGHLERAQDALTLASAFGHPLNHGWELTGPASADLRREWDALRVNSRWNGHLDVAGAKLQAAGLNQPLQLSKARLEWNNGGRSVQIAQAEGFGALWSGEITQPTATDPDATPSWNFQLHANHLDAADLDRWVGPRARPGWLRRLLPSLLGRLASPDAQTTAASALLRRLNAEGELRVDEFNLEKIRLHHVRANLSLHDLHLDVRSANADWAGGKVIAKLRAAFAPRPAYDITAQLDGIDLVQIPATDHTPERFAGLASANLHLTTEGLGRAELLQNLSGKGDVKLRDVEFNGWDINATVADGEARAGSSRWPRGEGTFTIEDRGVTLSSLRLDAGPEITWIKGTVDFGRETDLSIQVVIPGASEDPSHDNRRVLKVSGPLDLPRFSVEKLLARQPAD